MSTQIQPVRVKKKSKNAPKRNYYKEENIRLRKKIKELEDYKRGMTDAIYYLGRKQ